MASSYEELLIDIIVLSSLVLIMFFIVALIITFEVSLHFPTMVLIVSLIYSARNVSCFLKSMSMVLPAFSAFYFHDV